MINERPRGLCCHEAGHVVVAWSFRLPVKVVWVAFNEAKGWHGKTELDDFRNPIDLDDEQIITNLVAGLTAERAFTCPAHEGARFCARNQIYKLLKGRGMPEDQHWPRVEEAIERARPILETHRDKVVILG